MFAVEGSKVTILSDDNESELVLNLADECVVAYGEPQSHSVDANLYESVLTVSFGEDPEDGAIDMVAIAKFKQG